MARAKKITLRGRVLQGGGTGRIFTSLPWVKKQCIDKLGFDPYPGTLNLRVTSGTDGKELRKVTRGIKIESPEGFCEGRCFKASIMGKIRGAVVVPDVPGYPHDLLEILGPANLREKLGLKDGMDIEVTVWLK